MRKGQLTCFQKQRPKMGSYNPPNHILDTEYRNWNRVPPYLLRATRNHTNIVCRWRDRVRDIRFAGLNVMGKGLADVLDIEDAVQRSTRP